MSKGFFKFFLTLCLINFGDCIKCFQCNSQFHNGCDSIEKGHTWSSYYQPCDQYSIDERVFCRKTHLTINIPRLQHQRIIRSCGWIQDKNKNKSCYYVRDSDHTEVVCQCFQNGCNFALKVNLSLSSILITIAVPLLFV